MQLKYTFLSAFMLFSICAQAQNWEQKAAHPGDGRHHPVTFTIDSMAYLLTGSTNIDGATKDFYKYDPLADSWLTLPDFPGPARSYAYGAAADGKAYMGFGATTNTYLNDLWEFDPVTGDWNQLASCPCTARTHPAFVIQDQKIFVGLGNNPTNLKDWWEYDIASDSWRQLTDLPGPTRHHPFYFAAGGYVYVGLGHGAGIYKDWYRWDLDTETWDQMNDLPAQGRVAGTQLNIGDRGFVMSGDGENHGTIATGEFWEYDYQADSWTELPPHPGVSRWAPGSFAIGNTVYLTSGEIRPGNPDAGLQNDLWSFDLDAIASVENNDDLKAEITVYPNPTEKTLFINGLKASNTVSIEVFDSSGKTVKNGELNGNSLDVSELNPGLYFMTIKKNDEVVDRVKFVKE
ncbi:MAG: kelch repeat-containing protein [Brumimicrobium sp.]